MRVRLPSPDRIEDPELRIYLSQLVQGLERALERLPETPFMSGQIKIQNLTEQYTLDASTGTLGDVRSVLGTIVNRLREAGILP